MMSRCRFATVALACTMSISIIAAQETLKQIPARVELHSIQTLTLSDKQFLTGDSNAKPVTVSGEFRIAQGTGRLPVVVFMHGGGGMPGGMDLLTDAFNGIGISTFVIDSFTGRGVVSLVNDETQLDRLTVIVDAYRALDILARHPRVDPARIALMGASFGGHTALYASLKRFQKMWSNSTAEFAAYVPFYPSCVRTYLSDTDTADRPIRIFHGTGDDWNPIASCRAYVQRLRAAGRDVQLMEYPNALHGFDYAFFAASQLSPQAQVGGYCTIREEQVGVLINGATHQPFAWTDSCVVRGAHMGYDRVAATAAHKAVDDFLKTLFKLN